MIGAFQRKRIGVSGDPQGARFGVLFKALGRLFPVEFCPAESGEQHSCEALIVLNGDLEAAINAAAAGMPSFVAMEGGHASTQGRGGNLRFGDSPQLSPCLRRQLMASCESVGVSPDPEAGDEVLAFLQDRPVWLLRPTARAACHVVAAAPPQMRENEFLFQYLNGRRFLGLLPLMHFLRAQVKDQDWTGSSSKACFVFDDPSLHWHSYGFLNYRMLAEHAKRHGYFASVATIPLDAWWVNGRVAEILRGSSPRLSVLIHGNNHTTDEMLSSGSTTQRRAALAQAMRRMERLRRKHGIPIVNVMEAPYGAFAENLFQDLLVLGYEAALCTAELLVQHNPGVAWSPAIGLDRSEVLGGGLPVIPRIRMSAEWKNEVLLAAFLNQPIIVSGHHLDAAHDLEFLADLAGMVNGLHGVTWSDLSGILRSNFAQTVEGDVLTVKLYSRRVVVPIPQGTRNLRVQRSWISGEQTERLTISTGINGGSTSAAGELSGLFPVGNASEVKITSEIENPLDFSTVSLPPLHPWPIARKIMMEVRDRLSPAMPFIERFHRTAPPNRP
jgi:hypothetical protein